MPALKVGVPQTTIRLDSSLGPRDSAVRVTMEREKDRINQPGGDAQGRVGGSWPASSVMGMECCLPRELTQAHCQFLLGLRYVGLVGC